jgi:hypothetical protein
LVLLRLFYLCSSLFTSHILFIGRWRFSPSRQRQSNRCAAICTHEGPGTEKNYKHKHEQAQPRLSELDSNQWNFPANFLSDSESSLCLSVGSVCYVALVWQ